MSDDIQDIDLQLKLAPFQQRFRERCVEDLKVLRPLLLLDDLQQEPQKTALIELAHRVAGSGGLVGYMTMSDMGRELETQIRANTPHKDLRVLLETFIDEMESLAQHPLHAD